MLVKYYIPESLRLKYRIEINTINKDAKITDNTLVYEYTINRKKGIFNDEVFCFVRNSMLLNNSHINNPINEILILTSDIYSNLELKIDYKGNILRINNLENISNKWIEMKYILSSSYKGDVIQRIIKSIDKKIDDEKLMIAALYKDPFFYNYLQGVYANYKTDQEIFKGKIRDLINSDALDVTKKNKLHIDHQTGQINIASDYELCDESILRLEEYFKQKGTEKQISTDIKAEYKFQKNLILENILAQSTVYNDGQIYKSNTISVKLENIENL